MSSPRPPDRSYPRQALLACNGCGEVFINWTRSGTACRVCQGTDLREIRWAPADEPIPPRGR